MATKDEILNNLASLQFDNDSVTAPHLKIAEGVGICIDNTITEFSNTEANITEIINSQRYGKAGYYIEKALNYQEGDSLVIDPVTLDSVYADIDPTKRIIKQAAFEETPQVLFLKVAIENLVGEMVALAGSRFDAFCAVYKSCEVAGIPVIIISLDPNQINFSAKVGVYSTYDLATVKTGIKAAMTAFKKTFPFDGIFYSGDLEAYIKSIVPGIRDFHIYGCQIYDTNTGLFIDFEGEQALIAGYFVYNLSGHDSDYFVDNLLTYETV
jgi:hypothetical protein